jgi:hypothetical protein
MTKEIGWAEPGIMIGQPRVQKVQSFTYLYAEQQLVFETEVGNFVPGLYKKVQAAYEQLHGDAEKPPMLLMCINVPEQDRMYHLHAGYMVAPGTPATGEVQVRDVPPALVASIVTCCDIHSIWKCYSPLMDFMNQNGLQPLEEGWREYTLYFEGPDSMNNITWVMHLAAETN